MSRKSFLKAKIFFYLTLNSILSKRNDSCFCLKQNKRKNKKTTTNIWRYHLYTHFSELQIPTHTLSLKSHWYAGYIPSGLVESSSIMTGGGGAIKTTTSVDKRITWDLHLSSLTLYLIPFQCLFSLWKGNLALTSELTLCLRCMRDCLTPLWSVYACIHLSIGVFSCAYVSGAARPTGDQ